MHVLEIVKKIYIMQNDTLTLSFSFFCMMILRLSFVKLKMMRNG